MNNSTCPNHPLEKIQGQCNTCGEQYCKECLFEGLEYYYCVKSHCQAEYQKSLDKLNTFCPNCGTDLILEMQEFSSGRYKCPGCRRKIKLHEIELFFDVQPDINKSSISFSSKSEHIDDHVSKIISGLNQGGQKARLYIDEQSFIEVIYNSDNKFSLSHQFNRDDYYTGNRDDLSRDQVTQIISLFAKFKCDWDKDIIWKEIEKFPGTTPQQDTRMGIGLLVFLLGSAITYLLKEHWDSIKDLLRLIILD
jgi:hypothetical protein